MAGQVSGAEGTDCQKRSQGREDYWARARRQLWPVLHAHDSSPKSKGAFLCPIISITIRLYNAWLPLLLRLFSVTDECCAFNSSSFNLAGVRVEISKSDHILHHKDFVPTLKNYTSVLQAVYSDFHQLLNCSYLLASLQWSLSLFHIPCRSLCYSQMLQRCWNP